MQRQLQEYNAVNQEVNNIKVSIAKLETTRDSLQREVEQELDISKNKLRLLKDQIRNGVEVKDLKGGKDGK